MRQFLDTPTREKGQFLGDAVDISTATMAGHGERALTRQAIRQPPLSGLEWAAGEAPTQRGQVGVDWRASGRGFTLQIDVPVNVRAEVHVPARDVTAVRITGRSTPRLLGFRDGHAVYEAGSGRLTFHSPR